jgi:hypothetical protein
MRVGALLFIPTVLALCACVTQPMPKPGDGADVGRAVQQPMRDLSLVRDEAPAVLTRAWDGPYRTAPSDTCATLQQEVAELDGALGPDLADAATPANKDLSPDSLASGAVESAVGIPFRGIVRTITGAAQRDRKLQAVVSAGMVRRGFLKGRMLQMQCVQGSTHPA